MEKVSSNKIEESYTLKEGRYAGQYITRVPGRYLLAQVYNKTALSTLCQKELDRRGTPIPNIDVTAHAMDAASLRLLDRWKALRKKNEGLCSWLARLSDVAIKKGTISKVNQVFYKKMIFIFDFSTSIPILKTVMMSPKKKQDVHAKKVREISEE